MSHTARIEVAVPYLAVELDARRESISEMRRRVASFALDEGASASRVADIALAVSEAVTNAVEHAYDGRDGDGEGEGTVRVAADVEDDALEVVVTDDGSGLDGRATEIGAGLAIVAATSDDFAIRERLPHGLEVWMRFVLDT